MRAAVVVTLSLGCSFFKPYSSSAPILDSLCAGSLGGLGVYALTMQCPQGAGDCRGQGAVLAVVATTCAASAAYGFSVNRSHKIQDGDQALAALGAGLSAAGGAMTGTQPPPTGVSRRAACSSDYECDYGLRCMKPPNGLSGYCAHPVDPLGVPVQYAPAPNSVMPGGDGQCAFDVNCPVGFYCAVEPGALRGACLRR